MACCKVTSDWDEICDGSLRVNGPSSQIELADDHLDTSSEQYYPWHTDLRS